MHCQCVHCNGAAASLGHDWRWGEAGRVTQVDELKEEQVETVEGIIGGPGWAQKWKALNGWKTPPGEKIPVTYPKADGSLLSSMVKPGGMKREKP